MYYKMFFRIIDRLCRNLIKICKMYFKKSNIILDKYFNNREFNLYNDLK